MTNENKWAERAVSAEAQRDKLAAVLADMITALTSGPTLTEAEIKTARQILAKNVGEHTWLPPTYKQ